METTILEAALTQGIWAALSIVLIFYILKAQEKRDLAQGEREKNYQAIIQMLSTDLIDQVGDVKSEISEIQISMNHIEQKFYTK